MFFFLIYAVSPPSIVCGKVTYYESVASFNLTFHGKSFKLKLSSPVFFEGENEITKRITSLYCYLQSNTFNVLLSPVLQPTLLLLNNS